MHESTSTKRANVSGDRRGLPTRVELRLRPSAARTSWAAGRQHRRELDALEDNDAAAVALDHAAPATGGTVDHESPPMGLEAQDVPAHQIIR
jgi:hypothetical protein